MNTSCIAFVFDEDARSKRVRHACRRYVTPAGLPLDVTRVGEPSDLPSGTRDPQLLLWAEVHGRILVSRDKSTMPGHLANHLAAGHHSPGVFILRPRITLHEVLEYLALVADDNNPVSWRDQVFYIP
jgi:hypothetical protein